MKDWTEEENERTIDAAVLTDRERKLLQHATHSQIKMYGSLDQPTIEAIIVGNLICLPASDMKGAENPDTSVAVKIDEAGIKPDWFEDTDHRSLFEEFMTHFKENRELLKIEEAGELRMIHGQSRNDATMFKRILYRCKGAALARKINIDLVIERMITHHLQKMQDAIYQKAVKERSDPSVGPRKSWENMREACIRDLLDPRGAAIKEYDFVHDSNDLLSWLRDMKNNPERYRGAMCGIKEIDSKTLGFRPGQLTVFCGAHGGFKTTTMLNVGYGLWGNGYNVLYASLEMEAQNVEAKLLCRGTERISYSRIYNGGYTEPEDRQTLKDLAALLADTSINKEELKKVKAKYDKLSASLKEIGDSEEDSIIATRFYNAMGQKPNRLKIVNVGQSSKMKLSQLERWLHEKTSVFKPDVVLLDYLDLLDPEKPNPDRPDIGFGDICKMSRAMGKNMGFAIITAAQMKRAALDRLRKHGLDSPEKSQLGTDDISGSHMIGADADNVFMLWRLNGNELKIFTAKSRYGGMDNTAGATLQVSHDFCKIASTDQIETTERQADNKNLNDAYASAARTDNPLFRRTDEDEEELTPLLPQGTDDGFEEEGDFGPEVKPSADDAAVGDL